MCPPQGNRDGVATLCRLLLIDVNYFCRRVTAAMHADYHQPSDEADKIRFDRLADVVEMTTRMVRRYEAGAPRPRYQRPARFITPEMPVP